MSLFDREIENPTPEQQEASQVEVSEAIRALIKPRSLTSAVAEIMQEHRRWKRARARANKRARPPSGGDSEPPLSRRDRIRQQQAGQRRGPPPPDPEAIAQEIAAALVAPLTRMIATLMAPTEDRLIAQSEWDIPKRCGTRLCRALIERGDPRAAVRGRVHYLRQSAIDEWLRGSPRQKPAPEPVSSVRQLSAGERLERELLGAPSEPELWLEQAVWGRK